MKRLLFILILVAHCTTAAIAQSTEGATSKFIPDLLFTRFTSKDGLPDNRIRSVFQDSRGFLWVGTMNGVSKYDGYTFRKYYNTNDPNSISGNWAFAICEDKEKNIWIGTLNGLNLFDTRTEQFTSFTHIPGNKQSLFSNKITALQFDNAGMLWIGTQNGLARLNPATGVFDSFSQFPLKTYVSRIIRSQGDALWIATTEGMVHYNTRSNAFRFYPIKVEPDPYGSYFWSLLEDNKDLYIATATQGILLLRYNSLTGEYDLDDTVNQQNPSLQNTEVFDICRSATGDLWLATDRGLARMGRSDRQISFYKSNPLNPQSLSNNLVYTVFIDRTDNLWCGTELGLNRLNLHVLPFHYYTFRDPRSEDQVRSIFTVDGDNIWLGTAKNACYQYNLRDQSTRTFQFQPAGSPFNAHRSLYVDQQHVWLGTLGGAVQLNPAAPAASPKEMQGQAVFAFLKDSKGSFWIGTNDGLLQIKADGSRKLYTHNPKDSSSLSSVFIRSLYEDHNGRIWVGFETSGLSWLDPATGKFTRVKQQAEGQQVLGNIIYSIVEYPSNVLWVGSELGLNKLVLAKKPGGGYDVAIRNFLEQDGLPDKSVNGILPSKDYLWISTIKGLLRFHIGKESFQHFLPTVNFSYSCAYKYNEHTFLFGTSDGFLIFDPAQVSANSAQPEVLLSELKLFNKEVGIGQQFNGDVILHQAIGQTKEIELNYQNNVFTIGFIGLHFSNPENNAYAYKMEGFDKDWINARATDRAVTYTNLDPGHYTFQVKASNGSGNWNETPATLQITILPPPWKTWWAITGYILLVGTGLILLARYLVRQSQQRHAFETERLLRLKDEEQHREQLSFFTNIAHELQTPLTLINGSVERYLYKTPPAEQNNARNRFLSIIHQQSSRLTYLVNQLLDFRKAEAGHLNIQTGDLNVSALLTSIARLFEPLREQKEMSFTLDIKPDILVMTDKDKLEKIVFNLLSNAFKHTDSKQEIVFSVQQENGWLDIEVGNSGCKLTEAQVQQLFDKYYVGDEATPDKYSHGFGLAFTRQLVQLLQGTLSVFTNGDWISFQVRLPATAPEHTITAEATPAPPVGPSYLLRSITAGGEPSLELSARENNKRAILEDLDTQGKKSILVVDDEPSIRFLLRDIFSEHYIVYEAENGRQALEFMQNGLPDLIISDVMMPEIGGLELCHKVKSAPATSHIPFVLLSARGSLEQKTEGYDAGADAYIPKPFDTAHLQVRVRKLLEYRGRLLDLFKKDDIKAGIAEEELEDTDKKFLNEIVRLIEEHMDDTELDSAFLEEKLRISKTQLYRKLKALSDMAPAEFIKHVRLQRACHLLQSTQLTVSEIFYKTGFNNRSYFFREFKKRYNCSPKEYRDQYRIQL
ncbi:MAG: two-component regulator propeller domain-containing protein [Candidatus Pseudobacter hemicellulosilyticus]|uniref:histidine kinase n=1 Tax=Candidatus Pseudobacter hemicellulosilyticus TaxID=3121375 RepID=A0AAJ6BF90_9BACT|nr:MAG: two-component regulator propeller domain-containing protein [Pseudobacter sp.]